MTRLDFPLFCLSVFPTHVFDCYQSNIYIAALNPQQMIHWPLVGSRNKLRSQHFFPFKGTVHNEIKHTHSFLLACCVTYKSTPVAFVLLCILLSASSLNYSLYSSTLHLGASCSASGSCPFKATLWMDKQHYKLTC